MADDPQIQTLGNEFRRHLEVFYAKLKLASPYHSVEKAIAHLTASLKALTPEERAKIVADPSLQWAQYRAAFVESGLILKHRGIIIGLIRSGQVADVPTEYQTFLDAFRS